MSVRVMLVVVVALFAQVYSARVAPSHISAHAQTLKQQLITKINPSGLIPTAPNPNANNTHSPTGFIFLTNSYDSACATPFLTYGVPVNQCIVEANYAYEFQIVQDSCAGGIIQYFLDTECKIATGSTDLEIGTDNCTIAANPIVSDGSRDIYSTLSCTSSGDIPRTSDNGAVVITEYVNTTTCDTNADYAYIAFTNRACIQIDNNSFVPGCVDGLPVMNYDITASATCSGALIAEALPDSCEIDAGQPESDDEVYTPWFINPPPTISTTAFPTASYVQRNGSSTYTCQQSLVPSAEPSAEPTASPTTVRPTAPSAAPSFRPTFAKTSYPTSSSVQTVSFSATQIINGISYTTYSGNVALYSSTLISAIAASMQEVPTTAVTNFAATSSTVEPHAAHVSDTLSSALSLKLSSVSNLRRLQGSNAISTTYTVTTESVYTASQLASQLENAITSGLFDENLHTTATNNGATALTTASSGLLTVTYPQSSGGSSDKLSDGAIAGIVIGCVAGVAIIIALAYYFCAGGKAAMSSQPHVEL